MARMKYWNKETKAWEYADSGKRGGNVSVGSVVNVRNYGARGDGVTDDTAAVAAAIANLPTGGTLYFPAGTYMVDNINAKSDMTVQGDGWCSIIKLLPERTNYNGRNNCLNIENVQNIIVRDIKLDGDRTTQQSTASSQDARLNGIHMRYASDVHVENVWMYNNGYHGCIMTYTSNVVFERCRATDNGFRPIHGHTQIYNCRISNCVCENNGIGLTGGSGYNNDSIFFFGAQRIVINDNIVRSNRRGCITVGAEADTTSLDIIASSDITITGNVCECFEDLVYIPSAESDTGVAKFSSMGIVVYGGKHAMKNVTVSGNTIRNAHEAIYLYSLDETITCLNASIAGNTIINSSFGIYAVKVSDITVTGNQFRNLKEQLMCLQEVKRCTISGNNVYAPSTNDHRLCRIHSSNGIVISGNQFISDAQIAVYAPDSNTNVVVIDNVLSGFTTENPVTNTNGTIQGNVILQAEMEPIEPDEPESDVEIEKICVDPYLNPGFVRKTLVTPSTDANSNWRYTNITAMTDADVKYELNTLYAVQDKTTEPEEWDNPSSITAGIAFLAGENVADAVGFISVCKPQYGTVVFKKENYIDNEANSIYGATVFITAQEALEAFPTATHYMMQVAKSDSDPDSFSSVFKQLTDGHAYVYREK